MNKKIFGLSALVLVILIAPVYAETNISIMYGWNGTNYIPVKLTSEGKISTDINMTQSVGLSPQLNNTYDLGAASAIWANLYVRSIRGGSGPLSLFAGNTELITMLANGNVGIGTTSPTSKLQVTGDTNITGTIYAGALVANLENSTGLTNVSVLYGVNESATTQPLALKVDANGALKMSISTGTGTGWSKAGANIYPTTLTDSVGIGTATPASKLHVAGDMNVTGVAYTNELNVSGSGNSTFAGDVRIYGTLYGGSPLKVGGGLNVTGGIIYTTIVNTVDNVSLNINNTLYVNGSNVGIGTTSPGSRFHVYSPDGFDSGNYISYFQNADVTNGHGSGVLIAAGQGSSDYVLRVRNRTQDKDMIAVNGDGTVYFNGGNVGIGTTSPLYLLDVRKDQNATTLAELENQNTGSSAYTILSIGAYGNSWGMRVGSSAANSNQLDFVVDAHGSPVPKMSITTTGNVGIGTTGPSYKLHVADSSAGGVAGYFVETGTNTYNYGTLSYATGAGTNNYAVYGEASGASGNNFGGYFVGKGYFSGNVGIGTTGPIAPLSIYGGASQAGGRLLQAWMEPSFPTSYGITFWSDANSGNYTFYTYENSVDKTAPLLTLQRATKNVGIGTTAPEAKLHVVGGITETGVINLLGDGAYFVGGHSTYGYRFNNIGDTQNNVIMYDNGNMHVRGNVGIGTTSPINTLTVKSGSPGYTPSTYSGLGLQSNGHQYIMMNSAANYQQGIYFGGGAENEAYMTWEDGSRGDKLVVAVTSGGVYLSSGATSWTSNSDARIKEKVENVGPSLEKLLNLRPVTYNLIAAPNSSRESGFIAQEVKPYFPQLVTKSKDADGYYGLNYDRFAPYLVKSIQELNNRTTSMNAEQQTQIDELKAENAALQARIAALENKIK